MRCPECDKKLHIVFPKREVVCRFCRYLVLFNERYEVVETRPAFTREEARRNLRNTSAREVAEVMRCEPYTDGRSRRIFK